MARSGGWNKTGKQPERSTDVPSGESELVTHHDRGHVYSRNVLWDISVCKTTQGMIIKKSLAKKMVTLPDKFDLHQCKIDITSFVTFIL